MYEWGFQDPNGSFQIVEAKPRPVNLEKHLLL